MTVTNDTIPFIVLVQNLQNCFDVNASPIDQVQLINQEELNETLKKIVSVFKIGDVEFDIKVGEETERGDVSGIVVNTTYSRYPQNTPHHKLISVDERQEWLNVILENLKQAVTDF